MLCFSPRCRSTKASKMDLTLVSGAWPLHPPSPHATLVVVPGMRQTAAHARNVVQNVRRMGKEPFSCVVFLYESIPLAGDSRASGALLVKQVCTVMRWVGRNVIDYLKLLDANVTRGFGGGVLVSMQAGLHKWPMPTTKPRQLLVGLVVQCIRVQSYCSGCPSLLPHPRPRHVLARSR